jgi:error-prone DNA polymerase
VQDAQRHGVDVRPVDVCASEWYSTLEAPDRAAVQQASRLHHGSGSDCDSKDAPALRLGLHLVKGLGEAAAQRIVAARRQAAFRDSADFFRRTQLGKRELDCLADANALVSLAGHRRQALWQTLGKLPDELPLAPGSMPETQIELLPPSEGENLVADYRRLGLTLGRHPLALLRPRLQKLKAITAEELAAVPEQRGVLAAGIVTCRQRPGTASGVVFVTLEDETGCVNVVVWNALVERQRKELLGSRLLGVHGVVERKDGVPHLIAGKLVDYSTLLGSLTLPSRDFH